MVRTRIYPLTRLVLFSAMTGFCLAHSTMGVVQDFMGLSRFVAFMERNWLDSNFTMPIHLGLSAFFAYQIYRVAYAVRGLSVQEQVGQPD